MNFINSVKAFKLVTDESKNAWSIQAVMLLLRRLHDQVKCFVTTDHQREPLPAGAGGGGVLFPGLFSFCLLVLIYFMPMPLGGAHQSF